MRLLDHSKAREVGVYLLEQLDSESLSAEEAIPGLVQAIVMIAQTDTEEERLLDEAANLLADGGVGEDND